MASSRWDPVVTVEEGHYTNYVYPAAWLRLNYRMWWLGYRPRLMAAYPWSLTWIEYVERYRFFQALYEAFGEVS